ncbi:MAG: hypothetical protein KDE19_01200, partial [Caldilineaceae bacterium]|nr:hypothetical protein [Caldilineaceae bacterium]
SDGSSPTAVPSGGGCDSIPSGTSKGYYMGSIAVADGLWSAVISSDQPIAAVGNATCTSSGCTGDTVYAYNPINR